MKHKLWFNQVQGFAYMQIVGGLTTGDVDELFSRVNKLFESKPRHYLIIDLRLGSKVIPSKELRDTLKARAHQIGLDRIAVIGADPVTKMTFKVLLSTLSKRDVSTFCGTEREALSWLKKENHELQDMV